MAHHTANAARLLLWSPTRPHARHLLPKGKTPADWTALHARRVSEATAWHSHQLETRGDYPRLALLGDSITERLGGTRFGERYPEELEEPLVLQVSALARSWPSPIALGISGDQTQHLLWRLKGGEVSAAMAADRRLVLSH
ncbi:hypothetical protein AB1Y20_018988 [Prymnesium parvum]|uniref:SGNH hydrolase-type esterase domain-containing protein n=1 Tax=Prymnesium parvum TaxID=97485 RepID=A0AB34JT68_PRYPA